MKKLTALLAAVSAMLVLAACADESDHEAHDSSSIPESEEFNQADVDFATHMIQHHAQALAMVDLVRGRDVSPEVQKLSDDILMAQGPEIELMSDWLMDWGQEVPETVRDHANAHGHGEADVDTDMPGMMSEEQMSELEAAQGEEFEQLWLEMMIEHHEGAIEMAQTEQEDGEFPEAVDLAETIEAGQQAEIDRMEELLGS